MLTKSIPLLPLPPFAKATGGKPPFATPLRPASAEASAGRQDYAGQEATGGRPPPFTHPVSTAAHDVVQNLRLLEPLGIAADLKTARYEFPLTPDDRAEADAWLAKHTLGNRTLIGLHPGSYGDLAYKRWPAERFAELGDLLSATHDATVLVFGGSEEHQIKSEVAARMHAPSVIVEVPLRVTAALIARCVCFVSNDSGLMHLAVSQSIPTFGLFGPTDERRTAPWGPYGHVIRAADTAPTYDVHRQSHNREQTSDPSLLALPTEIVFDQVSQVVSSQTVNAGRRKE